MLKKLHHCQTATIKSKAIFARIFLRLIYRMPLAMLEKHNFDKCLGKYPAGIYNIKYLSHIKSKCPLLKYWFGNLISCCWKSSLRSLTNALHRMKTAEPASVSVGIGNCTKICFRKICRS